MGTVFGWMMKLSLAAFVLVGYLGGVNVKAPDPATDLEYQLSDG